MAFTPIYIEGFEHGAGVNSSGLFSDDLSHGDGLFPFLSGNGFAGSSQTTHKRSGDYGCRFTVSAGSLLAGYTFDSASQLHEGLVAIKLLTAPDTTMQFFQITNAADDCACMLRIDSSGHLLTAFYNGSIQTGQTSSNTIKSSDFSIIKFAFDTSTATWKMDVELDGVAMTQATFAGGSAVSRDRVTFGSWNANTSDLVIDDIVIGEGSVAEHPVPNYYIKGYTVDSVGTHNLDATPSAAFFKDIGGTETAITTSETDSWQVIDTPIDFASVDDHVGVRGLTDNEDLYLEYGFQNSAEPNPPICVRALIEQGNDSNTVNDISMILLDPSSTSIAFIYSGSVSEAGTYQYRDAVMRQRPSGGDWTITDFNGLKLRWGFPFSSAGTPRLYTASLQALFVSAVEKQTVYIPRRMYVRR